MTPRDFALACLAQKEAMMRTYADSSRSEVGAMIHGLHQNAELQKQVIGIVDAALTDAFYSMLLALDGCASLGTNQQMYRLHSQTGEFLTDNLETHAYEVFHGKRVVA